MFSRGIKALDSVSVPAPADALGNVVPGSAPLVLGYLEPVSVSALVLGYLEPVSVSAAHVPAPWMPNAAVQLIPDESVEGQNHNAEGVDVVIEDADDAEEEKIEGAEARVAYGPQRRKVQIWQVL